jgi:TolB protein
MLTMQRVHAMVVASLLWPMILRAQRQMPEPIQLTHGWGDAAFPSPDGRRLVYIVMVDGREQLFVMQADGSNRVALTHDAANHEDPAWSPDGRHIAYVSYADSSQVIWMMNSDGTDPVAITPTTVRAIHPSWSRDSRRLLYCTDDDLHPPAKNTSEIYSVDLRTRRAKLLVSGGVNTYPSLSRDGRFLAFRRMLGEHNSEVFVAHGNGSAAHNVSNDEAFDGWPEWSPDGNWLAFASNRGGTSYRIWVMRPNGRNPQLVANTTGRATAPHWAPDGRSIYFTNCVRGTGGAECEVYRANAP